MESNKQKTKTMETGKEGKKGGKKAKAKVTKKEETQCGTGMEEVRVVLTDIKSERYYSESDSDMELSKRVEMLQNDPGQWQTQGKRKKRNKKEHSSDSEAEMPQSKFMKEAVRNIIFGKSDRLDKSESEVSDAFDSDPELEYDETSVRLDKFLKALTLTKEQKRKARK